MTVANQTHQSMMPSLAINIDKQSVKAGQQWKYYVILLLQQIWWRLYAYGVVFKVMLLTLGSLVFLYVHWMSRNVVSGASRKQATQR